MANSKTSLKYDELRLIAKSLHHEAEDSARLFSTTRQKMNALRHEWSGRAADSFFDEMESLLLPGVNRTSRALFQAESALNKIMEIIQVADQETTAYFKDIGSTLATDPRIQPAMPHMDWLKGFHIDGFGGKEGSILELVDGKWVDGKVKNSVNIKIGYEGALDNSQRNYTLGKWDVGGKIGWGEGPVGGVYGEFDAFKTGAAGCIGTAMFGFTPTVEASAGSANFFAGFKEGSWGAEAGASVVAGEVGLGFNILGKNIRVIGGLQYGLEFGGMFGPETRFKLGPFKVGLSIGKALTNSINENPI